MLSMGLTKGYTKKQVLTALKDSYGIISIVAERLNCAWATANRFVHLWPLTEKAYKQETEIILDYAESAIFKAVERGDTSAAKWILSTRGKSRGYTDRVEITGNQEALKKIEVFIDLPKKELKALEDTLKTIQQ